MNKEYSFYLFIDMWNHTFCFLFSKTLTDYNRIIIDVNYVRWHTLNTVNSLEIFFFKYFDWKQMDILFFDYLLYIHIHVCRLVFNFFSQHLSLRPYLLIFIVSYVCINVNHSGLNVTYFCNNNNNNNVVFFSYYLPAFD